ncbi:helix-turn-helix domain-containing protein, partial [Klebsiella pneumoniae]|uniref:helix-turn-helix domain-containing protein n=1 Tax=Klebsiella pneumoniae TaxID=573 RepID=UPI003D2FAEAC
MTNLVAQAIKDARTARGWSKAKLARQLGISAAAVSQWESGATFPNLARLIEASGVLDIDL